MGGGHYQKANRHLWKHPQNLSLKSELQSEFMCYSWGSLLYGVEVPIGFISIKWVKE